MAQIRSKFEWLTQLGSTVIKEGDSRFKWWTFAGQGTNASLVPTLAGLVQATVDYDDLAINFESDVPIKRIGEAIRELRTRSAADLLPSVEETAISGIKFSEVEIPFQAITKIGS